MIVPNAVGATSAAKPSRPARKMVHSTSRINIPQNWIASRTFECVTNFLQYVSGQMPIEGYPLYFLARHFVLCLISSRSLPSANNSLYIWMAATNAKEKALTLKILCLSSAWPLFAHKQPGGWSGDYLPCDRDGEFVSRDYMSLGVRFAKANPGLAVEFRNGPKFLDYSAGHELAARKRSKLLGSNRRREPGPISPCKPPGHNFPATQHFKDGKDGSHSIRECL